MKVKKGDDVLLLLKDGSSYLIKTGEGVKMTHRGNIDLSKVVGKEYGSVGRTSTGEEYYILVPGIVDYIFKIRRKTQIVYPKDAAFIIMMLDIKEGDRVIDAGLGSGALCMAFARYVGSCGKVYAYERREDFIRLAKENLKRFGVLERVEIKHRDIKEGFDEKEVDAVMIDVNDSWNYIHHARDSLKGGGRIGIICPTVNQVEKVLEALESGGFINLQVWENLFRMYKPVPKRLRPVDRMVAHTAYLVFATKVSVEEGKDEYEEDSEG